MYRGIVGVIALSLAAGAYAEPVLRPVRPQDTDPQISTDFEVHITGIDPEVTPRGILYVHLVGSCGHPANNLEIVRHAASLGFHVLSVNYPDCPSVNDIAAGSDDPLVYEHVRRERIYGVDVSEDVEVSRADCIENRLVRLIQYMEANYPGEGWGQYLDGESPRWGSILLGGHSQGSGHAAFIGKEHEVLGTLLFSGPDDGNMDGLPAWVLAPGVTPAERMVGFTHALDNAILLAGPSYVAMGMDAFGAPVNVDNVDPPYRRSHILTSLLAAGEPGMYHLCVVQDAALARNPDGTPVYAPVWTYMFQIVTCPGDYDGDGIVNSNDFFRFLAGFFELDQTADFNYDGTVNSQDFFDYLTAFFTGC